MKINNKLLREKSSIRLYLSNNLTYTSNAFRKLNLSKSTSKGSNLTLYDGGVKIGSGITHVLVSGQVYFMTGSNHTDGKLCDIYKNSSSYSTAHVREAYNYIHVPNTTIIPVSEGDVIYLYAKNDTSANQTVIGGGSGNTFLNVIEI